MLLKKPLAVIFFTIFVDLLGFGILIPIIPLLLADPRSAYFLLPSSFTIQQGFIMLGFLMAVFPLGQFISTPILGQLSDKYGRKKLLALCLAGTSFSYVLFAIGILTKNIPLLFISRFFDGITGGNISVAQAAIADITLPQDRAKNFGLMGAAFGLGFIIGPYIGGKLSDPSIVNWFNAATPFWFAAILSSINVLSMLFFFPETRKVLTDTTINWTKSLQNIATAYMHKELRTVFASIFLLQGGFAFLTTFFGVYLIRTFKFTQGGIGDFFSYIGIWIALTQIIITRKVAHMFREDQVLRVTLPTMGFCILLFFLPTNWWGLLMVAPFFAVFNGLSQANMPSLISRSVGPDIQGEVLGITASVQALAMAIPPMFSGFIAAKLSPESTIFTAAIIVFTSGILFNLFYKPQVQKP